MLTFRHLHWPVLKVLREYFKKPLCALPVCMCLLVFRHLCWLALRVLTEDVATPFAHVVHALKEGQQKRWWRAFALLSQMQGSQYDPSFSPNKSPTWVLLYGVTFLPTDTKLQQSESWDFGSRFHDLPIMREESLFFCLWVCRKISHTSGWPQFHYGAEDRLAFLIILNLLPMHWEYRKVIIIDVFH